MNTHRNLVLALLIASPLLAACMPDSPETQLVWDANTHMTKNQVRATPQARPRAVARSEYSSQGGARTYVYQDKYAPRTSAKTRYAAKSRAPDYVNGNQPVYAYDDSYGPTPRPKPEYGGQYASNYGPVTSQPLAPVGNAPRFDWPVNGRTIAGFGSSTNGGRNDGIDIAAGFGTAIHAAASGTVTYSGDELRGYGNLLLIRHVGGFTTAYAHADKLTVQKGDMVMRGQVIGYVGQTGDVNAPQLHFEIRRATTPVDPRPLLSSNTASNGY